MLKPVVDPKLEHWRFLWERAECYRYYVRQRRRHCTSRERLDLWLKAPCCEWCIQSGPGWVGPPDLTEDGWEVDLMLAMGPVVLRRVKAAIKAAPEYAFACKRCGTDLRPWEGDEVYVISYHLEEHYGIPLETPGKTNPSKSLREQIFELYGKRCFECGRGDQPLHLDHIRPRAAGGDAAFRNLQPLCEPCGQAKGSAECEDVGVVDGLYFGPYPSDAYEGLFW